MNQVYEDIKLSFIFLAPRPPNEKSWVRHCGAHWENSRCPESRLTSTDIA